MEREKYYNRNGWDRGSDGTRKIQKRFILYIIYLLISRKRDYRGNGKGKE